MRDTDPTTRTLRELGLFLLLSALYALACELDYRDELLVSAVPVAPTVAVAAR